MSDRSGVSRGDRNRNARLARLRAAVPLCNAIAGIDLADARQMVVVTDHESRVLARRVFQRRAWQLGAALDWAAARARAAGFAGVTVAVEPTGHRWRVVGQLAADRQMPFVCVQPLMSSWARRAEDLTSGKTDGKDAVLIARLAGQLRCYLPEPADETWARLRHLGIRRARLVAGQTAQVQQMRDLLECAWPAVLDAARQPFKSTTWHAALTVALARAADGDLERVTRLGRRRFDAAARRQVARWGAVHPIRNCSRVTLRSPASVRRRSHGSTERDKGPWKRQCGCDFRVRELPQVSTLSSTLEVDRDWASKAAARRGERPVRHRMTAFCCAEPGQSCCDSPIRTFRSASRHRPRGHSAL
jgi:transposase